MADPARILVVDDEPAVQSALSRAFSLEDYDVSQAMDGREALERLSEAPYEVVILDISMPHVDGLEVCRRLREGGDRTPVLMLTAREEIDDRVLGLDAGADDYLVKPFAFEELLARIRAVLRRAGGRAHPQLRYEDLVLDPAMRRVTRAGHELRLTVKEYALLQFLLENAGRVVSRTRILEAVWEQELENYSNVVEVYIRYLRAKVDAPFPVKLIQTVRGVGYSLRKES